MAGQSLKSRRFGPKASVRRPEEGFALVELLVVILIIGILAAIALAVFLRQQERAYDTEAKSQTRDLMVHVESCFVETGDYTKCDEPGEYRPPVGLAWGNGPGEVQVDRSETTPTSFRVSGVSRAQSNGVNHVFRIRRDRSAATVRSCETGGSNDEGGCRGGTW